jgi:hypothetical protein
LKFKLTDAERMTIMASLERYRLKDASPDLYSHISGLINRINFLPISDLSIDLVEEDSRLVAAALARGAADWKAIRLSDWYQETSTQEIDLDDGWIPRLMHRFNGAVK